MSICTFCMCFVMKKRLIEYQGREQTVYHLEGIEGGLLFENSKNRCVTQLVTGEYKGYTIPTSEYDTDADSLITAVHPFDKYVEKHSRVDFLGFQKDLLNKQPVRWYKRRNRMDFDDIDDDALLALLYEKYGKDSKEDKMPSFKMLEKYGTLLNDQKYLTNPAVGRDAELHNLILSLLSREKSALLVGPPGVGKTSIVEGLAYQLQLGTVPRALENYQIFKVNTSSLVSGTRYRGDFEKRCEDLLKEVEKAKQVFLFIDELHTVIGAGSSSDSTLDFANMLKPYLDRGQIKIIGATTSDEYERYIENDPALKRRFKKVDVLEPTDDVMYEILEEKLKDFALKTKLEIPFNDAEKELIFTYLLKVTEKARRVYNDILYNPDLALSIMDTAFACALSRDQDKIECADFAEAMCLENRINKSSRETLANSLLTSFEELNNEVNTDSVPKLIKLDFKA